MSRYLTKRGGNYLRITNILDIQAASSEKKNRPAIKLV